MLHALAAVIPVSLMGHGAADRRSAIWASARWTFTTEDDPQRHAVRPLNLHHQSECFHPSV